MNPNQSTCRKGLLVVSFGTSYEDTRKKNIEHIEQLLREAFPDRRFYHAYTSGMILKVLRERDNLHIPAVSAALETIVADGITDLLVQPTHILNGIENDNMTASLLTRRNEFDILKIGAPLLTSTEDQFAVIDAITRHFSPAEHEALVLMGHGSDHYANSIYAALDYAFHSKGHKNIYVGTVEAYPDLAEVICRLKKNHVKKIILTPFMLVAGDHATNDLAGPDADSWRSILTQEGFEVECVLKGLGEYDEICSIYLQHALSA